MVGMQFIGVFHFNLGLESNCLITFRLQNIERRCAISQISYLDWLPSSELVEHSLTNHGRNACLGI
jgi:hypothetical protein